MRIRLALKVDVDTDRGTREGVPNLLQDLQACGVPACFLFSLGPDQTGRAVTRIFRRGFLRKVGRTNVVKLYGVRTLLNGTLLPAPHIGRRNAGIVDGVGGARLLADGRGWHRGQRTARPATVVGAPVRAIGASDPSAPTS